ncbi:MAG: glycosyltransferase family 4 protein [candidate division Zixibacteria bacterium]|nr:glycosyltransferase family 4 protein [candidate division Zixibacteria bacterium]
MNLLFLPKLLPRKDIIGGPILIYHRIKNLSRMGHQITLITPAYDEQDRKDKSLEPFCEKIIKMDSTKQRSEEEIEELYKRFNGGRPRFFLSGDGGFNQRIEDAFKAVLKEKHFEAIIAEYSMMGQYIEANSDFISKDTMSIISVHESYTKAFKLRAERGENISEDILKELFTYEFKMYIKADIILTLTKEDAEILIDYAPQLTNKIRIIPHGVDTDFYIPPKENIWNRNTKNILYLGNYQHYPNVDAVKNFVNNCWVKILRQVPDAQFFAIGYKSPPELFDLKNNYENITIQQGGDNENVRRIYWKSDIMVAPIALGTGFRGKLLEAMACGLPVVATKLATFGINPENEVNMFVTDDYNLFSDYVIRLLKDTNLRRKTSRASLELAQKFDHRNAAMKLDQVLKE